jgi:hypothetical protein
VHLDGAEMLATPGNSLIDPNFFYQLSKVMEDWHGDPLAAVGGSDPIAILPLVFLELHRIQCDKKIRLIDLIQIPEPGKKLRLMNRDSHKQAFSLPPSAGESAPRQ